MAAKTAKILDPDIRLSATCVQVPVFIGHSLALNVEFRNPVTEDDARKALQGAPGVTVVDAQKDGWLCHPVGLFRQQCHVCQPHSKGRNAKKWAEPLDCQ